METALLLLAILTLAIYAAIGVDALIGRARIPLLQREVAERLPRAAVVVAARNEEHTIEAGVRSLLSQTYPGLEVIVVDDRSDDGTSAILARMSASNAALTVLRIDELPEGWLGKTHALHRGAAASHGDWILFTDADVALAEDALARAVTLAERSGADHLTLGPMITGGSVPFRIFLTAFAFCFALLTRPWRASSPRSRDAIGIGAFNLVRRSALEESGGFARIALRPDDDLMLARLLKRSGFRNVFARSNGAVGVEWYATLRDAVHGLEKNAFATLEYSTTRLVGATLGMLVFAVWPFIALIATSGITWALNAITVVLMITATMAALRESRLPMGYALALPVSLILFLAIVWRSASINLRSGGIVWRGTTYPLDQIRRNRIH